MRDYERLKRVGEDRISKNLSRKYREKFEIKKIRFGLQSEQPRYRYHWRISFMNFKNKKHIFLLVVCNKQETLTG